MNAEPKRLWLEALRSGEYEQGRLRLRDTEDKFCCLGVACEVAIKAGVPLSVVEMETSGYYRYGNTATDLPDVVSDWLGVVGYDPVISHGKFNTLAGLNDSNFFTFAQIADVIEAQL